MDYAQIAAKEKLDDLQLRVRQLLDQIEQITKEQAYQRVSLLLCGLLYCFEPHIFRHERRDFDK